MGSIFDLFTACSLLFVAFLGLVTTAVLAFVLGVSDCSFTLSQGGKINQTCARKLEFVLLFVTARY